jgi:hypothetical protein
MSGSKVTSGLLVIAALLSCGEKQDVAPIIESLTGPARVSARDSAEYRAVALTQDGQQLKYHWSATRGRFAADTGDRALWFSPDSADTVWLRVAASNEQETATDSVRVIVMRDTTVFVWWWDGAVKSGHHVSWADTARAGQMLVGGAGTRSDTLDTPYLMVLDEPNYQRWVKHEAAEVLLRRVAYRADTFSVFVPATGQYRVVIDNTVAATDYNYWIYALRISR